MAQQIDIIANFIARTNNAEAGINKLKNSLNQLKIPANIDADLKKSFSNLDGLFARYKSQLENGFKTKGDVSAFAKTGKQIEAEYDRISTAITKLTGKEISFKTDLTAIQNAEKEVEKLIAQKEKLAQDIKGGLGLDKYLKAMQASDVGRRGTKVFDASNMLQASLGRGDIEKASADVERLISELNRMSDARKKALEERTGTSFGNIIEELRSKITGADQSMTKFGTDIKTTSDNMAQIQADGIDRANKALNDAVTSSGKLQSGIKQLNGEAQAAASGLLSMSTQLQQLQQSTQYFFSLRNMINLFKRGVREAVDTIKDLDKAMTATAVVTKFDVGDMWAKLPEYTARANELGATVQDMYEATTLYYQQGLNAQQAMEIAGETMKMARIGGLEAATATDMMTAALRGFNMELNEISAQRINDVYSNLAAKTASNTQELGTAMQRTASIAANAGMSFEGTAAFLAQAIETTREPAENIGTAMKTIVARFTELKKNPLEIADVDGEEVSYNKVDAALQSIGVSLKDTNGQFRDLDQVFLDISQRWDGLTQTQQRYIATTAAGSRQQSRFIAMMSNYERTMQLMDYANNAEGASADQFNKTLESLEAKLNKFQNAWKSFLMGIMNDSWTKGLVDAGTKVLTLVNNIINALSFGGKAKGIKSFLSLFAAFKGLQLAGRGINGLIGGLAGSLTPRGGGFVQGFKTGAIGQGRTEVTQATNRIINAINGLVPHIDGKAATTPLTNQGPGQYNQARKELINSLGGHWGQIKAGNGFYTAGGLLDIIDRNQLDPQQQKQFFQASPGLKKNLTKSLTQLYKDVGTDKKTTQALVSGFKSGDLGLKDALLGNDKLTTTVGKAYEQLMTDGQKEAAFALKQKHSLELFKAGQAQGLEGDDLNNFVKNNLDNQRILNEKGQAFLQNPQVLTTSQKIANVAGQIGAGFMAAGSAVQMFGAQVSQINPILGQAISGFGSLLMTVGSLANVLPSLLAGGATTWALGAAAAIGTIAVAIKAHTENIRKSGQEVVDTYKNTSDELNTSIDNIKGYQSELVRLSTGVDANGFNINLDDSEYQQYKDLVNDLIQQNPDIVKGWNSEGQAIIDVNSALKDTIKLKQKELKESKKSYLSDLSGQKLIKARNTEKGYKRATNTNSNFVVDANQVVNSITNSGLADKAVAAGFDLDKIRQGDLQAISFLTEHYSLLESIYKQGGQEMSNSVSELIGGLSDNLDAYNEAIAPVVDYLTEYAQEEKLFADLPVELTSAFNDGIKSIAGKDLEVGDMKKAVNYLGIELRDAFEKAEPFITDADEALDQFAKDLEEANYSNNTADAVQGLRHLADEARALGQVEIAEWYENQASQIENAIHGTAESISEYIDTLSDDIANAKANFDALGEGIDDYYSLADQAYGLVETALQDKNTEGDGSKTFWNTYRGLASEEAYNKHDLNEAIANMKQFQKYFTEGAEGSRAFAQKLIDWQDKEVDFGDGVTRHLSDFFHLAEDGTMSVGEAFKELTDEQYAQLAATFDLSSDSFTAILNKLRQFGDLEFTDPKGVRRAMAFDDRTVKTKTEIDVKGEKEPVNRLYYGQSMLEAEMADLEPEAQTQLVEDLTVQGAIQLPSGAENLLTKGLSEKDDGSLFKQFVEDTKGTGNQVENVMTALYQSGEYNKDELEKIHTALTEEGGYLEGVEGSDQNFEELYDHIEDSSIDDIATETNDHLTGIQSSVDTIAGIVAAGKIGEGFLPDVAKQSDNLYKELVGEKGVPDTWQQLFSKGKDKNGNVITDKNTYDAIRQDLKEQQTINNNYLEQLKRGRDAAEANGDSAAVAQYDEEIAKAEHNAALIAKYLSDAANVWGEYQAAEKQASDISTNAIDLMNTIKSSGEQDLSQLTGILQTAFGSLKNLNLTPEQSQTQITSILQSLAGKLQELNFNPEQIQGIFKENFGIELELEGGEFATDVGQQIQEQVNNLGETEINAILNISSINMAVAARGKNNTPSAIRRVGTMARGSKRGYVVDGEPTLTGELGPELVWEPKQNAAYMVGEHGPQFASLSKNAVVWNAKQTQKIKKNSKGVNNLGTGAYGIHPFGTMAGGNVGGGGTTIPGTFDIDAMANIQEVIPPTEEPSISVKAELEFDGGTKKDLLGGKEGPSVDVAARITSLNANEQAQTISVIGNITKLNSNITNNIDATAVVTRVTKSGQVAGEPITVQATATTTKVKNETPAPQDSSTTQTINVVANSDAAQAKINKVISLFNKTYELKYKASGPTSISVPISANFTGSWKKTVEITKSGAKGINNYITHYSKPTFGSAARGKYGQLGPKGKGGLTLTGELGYEVAWLPDENRSMILGVNGPQMIQLPGNAVVWDHEQSKKILKQKSIPAGSHGNNSATGNDILGNLGGTGNDGGGGGGGQGNKGNKGKGNKDKDQEKLVSKAGKVIVWWENQEHKIDAVLRKVDKSQKAFDKILKKASTTIEEVRAAAQTTIKDLQQSIQVNTQAKKRAESELEMADKGTPQQRKANKELKAAKKSKDKKRIKKAKQAVKKANAKAVALGTSAEISYETGSGKKKKTTKQNINLSKYIKYDKATGAYVIDQAAINKVAKKNKSKAEAIKNAANQVINDKQGKLNKAEDNIDKAKEQIDEIGQQIYDTFFSWRNELTKVYDLTQKLEATEKRRANLESGKGLIDAQIAAGKIGLDNAKAMSDQLFKGQIAATQASIKMGAEKIEAQKAEIKRADLNDDNQAIRRDISNQVSSINTILDNEKKYEDAKKKKNKFEKDEKEIKAAAKLAKGKSTTDVTKKELKAAKKDEQDKLKALKKQLKGTKNKKKRKKLEDKIAKAEKNIKTLDAGINAKSTYSNDKKAWDAVKNDYKSQYNISDNEVANLKARREELKSEQRALNEEHKTKEKARQYSKVSYNDDGTVNLEIDYDKIEADRVAGKITSAEADEIKEYLERIQEENNNLLDAYNEQTTRLTELYQSLADLKQQQADHAKELFDQYVENQRQAVENTKQLSDVISSSTKDLLDGVKNKLDERRKQEDNKKTEQDISKKQQRLAALRADTSGGHQVEIAQLQKEIGEAQESYGRTLEDQLLDSLNKQNDTAQKQREQQIALAEKQVELNTKNGIYAAHIDYLLENANSKSAAEEMRALWEQITGGEGLPAIIQETIQAQIDANMLDVQSFNDRYKILSDTIDGLSSYVDALQQALSDTASSLGTFAAGLNGESGPVLAEGAGRKYQTDSKKAGDEKTAQEIQEEVNEQKYDQSTMGHVVATATHSGGKTENGQIDTSGTKLGVARGSTLEIYKWDATNGVQGEFSSRKTIDKLTAKDFDEYPIEAKEALKYAIENQKPGTLINKKIKELVAAAGIIGQTFKLKNGIYGSVSNKGKIYYNDGKKGVQIWDTSKGNLKLDKYNKAEFKKKAKDYKNVGREYAQVLRKRGVPGYATGGLADYTGPAWLDGTPSKPELVLNARDTKNFIALKDVLAKAMNGIEDVPASYGDILYEININVDKIEKDYDVDKVVDKVKKEIVKTSGYRNVTQVRNLR